MNRILFSGGCHVLCWAGEILLVIFSPVVFEPYLHALLWFAIPATMIWFFYDIRHLWKLANTPFPEPSAVARQMSEETERRRQLELERMLLLNPWVDQ